MWRPNSGQGLDVMINIKKLWKEKLYVVTVYY